MKLRIENDTLRLRLSAIELEEFAQTGRTEGVVHFGPGPAQLFTYALERGSERPQTLPDGEPVQVHYETGALTILVPFILAKSWVETDQVGFSHSVLFAENQRLHILVEKDQDCRH